MSPSAAAAKRSMMYSELTCLRTKELTKACGKPRSGSAYKGSFVRNVALTLLIAVGAGLPVASPSVATPGGLNAQGCHNDRKGGIGYHCHNRSAVRTGGDLRALAMSSAEGARTYFANCSAARAAGAAPVRAGSPGYSRNLDRDGDGIGCE